MTVFTQWSMGMFPIVVVLFSFCYFLLTRYYPIKILTVIEADSVIDKQLRDCGRPLLEERFLAPPVGLHDCRRGFSGVRRLQSWLPLRFCPSSCCSCFAW